MDVMIETVVMEPKHVEELADMYKSVFKKHNIFQGPKKDIVRYIKQSHKKAWKKGGAYIVSLYYDPVKRTRKLVGGLLVMPEYLDYKAHERFSIKHVAVLQKFQKKKVGTELMLDAIDMIKNGIKSKKFKTAKIEIRVADGEKNPIAFYKRFGFKVEGKLSHHYRYKETTSVLGRLVK